MGLELLEDSLRMNHLTRSSEAPASSADEWPVDASPVWINLPNFSLTLSQANFQREKWTPR